MGKTKIELMHMIFGVDTCHTCSQCCNLIHVRPTSRPLLKCALYGDTSSNASDWRAHWMACGLFGKPMEHGETTVMERKSKARMNRTVCTIPGQLSMLDKEE